MLVERGEELSYGEEGNGKSSRQIWPQYLSYNTMDEVVEWLGFDDVDEYLNTLEKEEAFIFRRATY